MSTERSGEHKSVKKVITSELRETFDSAEGVKLVKPATLGGAILGSMLVGGLFGPLATIPGMLAGGVVGEVIERRARQDNLRKP